MENDELLLKLAKHLDDRGEYLVQQQISISQLRAKKRLLLQMAVAAQSLAEGIYVLCKENRSYPALVILKSLMENQINAKFVFVSNTLEHVNIFLLDPIIQKKKQLKKVYDFCSYPPSSIILPPLPSKKSVEKLIKQAETQIKKLSSKIKNKKKELGVWERAKIVDEYHKRKNLKSNSLEWNYLLVYCKLCNDSHLDQIGLSNFFTASSEGMLAYLSGKPDDIPMILELTHYLHSDILSMFEKTCISKKRTQA
ncbi:MAG: hypothetical protein JSR58_02845 [Verrucomicrobia bacterium]|nr:hypothetical protein [Verrucomicrobiota bacterium]